MIQFISDYLVYISLAILYLFIAFVFVARIKHKVVGTRWEAPAKYLLVVPFVIADWWVNVIMSLMFWDLPADEKELVTGRMKRYKYAPVSLRRGPMDKWRNWFARTICKQLNVHDKEHC